ncbi:restriction endonuclease subunit S domain-containing protein [Paracoccus xiamenensis]|uniref:restriction endonuclease subunit S n=1 Tax=Paracoccus xiamenensis TaxID=2714901 RepID=UPI00140AB92D|nr:restriction endonuclease subunit S [Paracoccus xiamenensis]NHF74889.1 hypothetical protein [Paracoccus xiamenensis]
MSDVDQMRLPPGWTLTPVGDLLKFKNGLNKGRAFFGYGTPIVNYMDVFRHAGLRRTDVHGLVDVTNAEKQAFSARKGDILFTRTSETPEEVGISTVLLEDIEDAVFSGFVLRGRPVSDRLTSEFAQYCFDSRFVRGQIVSSATYTTRALTNGRILSNVKLPLPVDPDEQQAIAAALSDADGVVAGLERVIAKKRLIKQGAMQDLLTARRRLPGFSGEWEVKRLGSLGVCLRGVSYDGSADLFETETPDSIMLLRANNVQNGEIVYFDVQHVRKERVKPVQCLKRGDVLVCMANGSRALVGKAGVFWDGDGSTYTFGAFMGCFRPAAGAAADGYVPFLFQSDEYRNQLNVILSGSAINNLAPSQILGFSFKMPMDHSEQRAITAVLSDLDAEIQTLESRLAKARAVKEGMMQNLLTGRVRLV